MFDKVSWINQIDSEYLLVKSKPVKNTFTPNSSVLNDIIKGLFKVIEENIEVDASVLRKIKFLSNKQLNHYKTSKFSFIERFFSALRNLFIFRSFHSSAHLANRASDDMLLKLRKNKEVKIHGIAKIPSTPPQLPISFEELRVENLKHIEKQPQPLEATKQQEQQSELEAIRVEIVPNPEPELIEKPIEAKKPQEVAVDKELSLKEALIQKVVGFWPADKHSTYINQVLDALFYNANIIHWHQEGNKFHLDLDKPLQWKRYLLNLKICKHLEFICLQEGSKKVIEFMMGEEIGMVAAAWPLRTHLNRIELSDIPHYHNDYETTLKLEGSPILPKRHSLPASQFLAELNKAKIEFK